jgi:hypothetical protein
MSGSSEVDVECISIESVISKNNGYTMGEVEDFIKKNEKMYEFITKFGKKIKTHY